MPCCSFRFTDPPADLLERLKPILVSQGDPPVYVFQVESGVEFKGPGGEFLLQVRAADALTTVWPAWQRQLVT